MGEKESLVPETPPVRYVYSMKLHFHTKVFGTFKQTVLFDFGSQPLLAKVRHHLGNTFKLCYANL
jgi:hypothetical protein